MCKRRRSRSSALATCPATARGVDSGPRDSRDTECRSGRRRGGAGDAVGWHAVNEDVVALVKACSLNQVLSVARLARNLHSVAAVAPPLPPPPLAVLPPANMGHRQGLGGALAASQQQHP